MRHDAAAGLGRPSGPHSLPRRLIRGLIHALCYRFILKRRWTTVAKAAGFRLVVPPTVFHPRIFLSSEFFASYIDRFDLSGQRVADVGTGTGILALAAARAGADDVVAIDINPNAARATQANARTNGLSGRVTAVCSNLMSGIAPQPLFDVILSSPPSFSGEPLDLADRAWHSGPGNRDIAKLFDQARERLLPGGRMYVLLSPDSDLEQRGTHRLREFLRPHGCGAYNLDRILHPLRAATALAEVHRRNGICWPGIEFGGMSLPGT